MELLSIPKPKLMKIFFLLLFTFSVGLCNGQDYFKEATNEYFHGDLSKSVTLFTKSIEHNQELAKSFMYRGAAKSFLKMFDEALDDLETSRKHDSLNAKLYFYFGKLYLFKGDYNRSIHYYNISIAKNRQDAASYDERGQAKLMLNDFSGAVKDVTAAISIDSTDEDFYVVRGYAKLQLTQYREAIDDFNHSLKILPNQKAYADRGLAYYLMKEYEKAIEDFDSSLSISPNDGEVYYYKGMCFKGLSNLARACANFRISKNFGYEKSATELEQIKCN